MTDKSSAFQKPIFSLGSLAQKGYWSYLRADTGTLFFLDKVQTQHSQTRLHEEESLFFVKGMVMEPLVTAGVRDGVVQELQVPMGPQMLEDVEEPMPARSATLRDPGTPDQLVVEQHNLTHFPSQPARCASNLEDVIHHIENSRKSTQWCPNFSLTCGYMEDGGALQIACCLVGTDTSSGAMHATMVPDSKRMDMPNVVAGTAKWVRDLEYERFLSTCRQSRSSFFSCCWTEWQKKFVLKDQMGRFYDKCHRHRAIRAMEPRRKAVSTERGLARKYLAVLKDNIPSFDLTTHSPMLPWRIRHEAWVLTRDTVRRDTRMTTFWKIRGQKCREEILPLQVLARRPVANVNQLLQT